VSGAGPARPRGVRAQDGEDGAGSDRQVVEKRGPKREENSRLIIQQSAGSQEERGPVNVGPDTL